MNRQTTHDLHQIFHLLLDSYGPRSWWPAETPFEVCIGAILTQNTSWGNVERAIANLKREGVVTPGRLQELPGERLRHGEPGPQHLRRPSVPGGEFLFLVGHREAAAFAAPADLVAGLLERGRRAGDDGHPRPLGGEGRGHRG